MSMKNILKMLFVLGFFLLEVGAAHAEVVTITAEELSGPDVTLIDFEDAELMPGHQYVPEYGVKFVGVNSQALRINDYNRNGDRTISGKYSIMNDAVYPESSANVPFEIRFVHDVSAVGFYLGNGVDSGEQVQATITVYGDEGQVLRSDVVLGVNNPVMTFYGVKSSEPIQRVSIDYGASSLSEDIDNVMFISSEEFVNMDALAAREVSVAHNSSSQGNNSFGYKPNVVCSDSDGLVTYQYGTQGVVEGSDVIGGKKSKFVDYCIDNTQVREYFCSQGVVKKELAGYNCAVEGKVCRQGACVPIGAGVALTKVLVTEGLESNKNTVDSLANRGLRSISKTDIRVDTIGDTIGDTTIDSLSTIVCEAGCKVDGKCVPSGTRLGQINGEVYCSWTGILNPQKELSAACQNNYECGTNQCLNSKCADMEKQLAETQSMIEQFKSWFASIWS